MKCPICGNPLRPSKKDPAYGLCDNCKKKFKLKKETQNKKKTTPSTAKSVEKQPKKKKKRGLLKFFLFFIIIVAIAGLAHFFFFGRDNYAADSSAASSQTTETDSSTNTTQSSVIQEETYNNVQISLISTSESKGGSLASPSDGNIFYICEFQITNNSEENITINSLSDIEAFCGDYSVSEDIAGLLLPETEDKSSLDGTIAMGQTFTGVVTYQIPEDYEQMQFRLSPDFWNSDTATFTISKE